VAYWGGTGSIEKVVGPVVLISVLFKAVGVSQAFTEASDEQRNRYREWIGRETRDFKRDEVFDIQVKEHTLTTYAEWRALRNLPGEFQSIVLVLCASNILAFTYSIQVVMNGFLLLDLSKVTLAFALGYGTQFIAYAIMELTQRASERSKILLSIASMVLLIVGTLTLISSSSYISFSLSSLGYFLGQPALNSLLQ